MEDHGLAGQVGVVVLGEGDVQILLLPGLHADHLLLKAGDEGAGAQLQLIVFALAALEGGAVVESLKVNDGGVALLGLALDAYKAGGPLDVGLELVVNVLLGDLDLLLGSGQALVGAQLDLGADGDQRLEGEALLAHLNDFHLGIAHVVQVLLLDGLLIGAGVDGIDGIFIKHAGAVHPLDDLPGGLALAEAGDGDAAAVLQIGLLNSSLELLRSDLDGQLDRALFFLLNTGDLHLSIFLLWACPAPINWSNRAFLLSPRYFIRYMSI